MKTKMGFLILVVSLFIASPTQAAFFRGLGDMPGSMDEDKTHGISADGAVVVGCGEGLYADEAFRWTLEGGLEGLGYLPGGEASCALGVSADGGVIVGYNVSGAEREAFRWTQAKGMESLGDLPGGAHRSTAHAVSADGSVVVGAGHTASGEEAFIWTQGNMTVLKTLLMDRFGLDLSGWTLTSATFVSTDGTTVVGHGINPEGEREAWAAHIGARTSAPVLPPPTGLRIVFD